MSLAIDFQCRAGEMLALVGPSGSGKSTVLRAIAGLHRISSGRVSCGEHTWLDTTLGVSTAVQQRRVGLVFQHYGLFPHKSALDNVALAVHAGTREQRRSLAREWLERTNMTGLEDRKPGQLSGGQRQRVALARALARDPDCLLLDEPFSAVDQQTRRRLYRELAKLRSTLDIPIVLVTHDIHEVQLLADRLCLIHKGRTLQQGRVQDVFNAPQSKSVARLLGHQNLLNATVIEHSGDTTHYSLGNGQTLTGPRSCISPAEHVTLLIAPTAISMHPEDQAHIPPSNTLNGCIRDAVGMGDEWSIRVHLDKVFKSLRLRVPLHGQIRHSIEAGARVRVTILRSGIHAIAQSAEPNEHKDDAGS